ncbi:hypothetical protein [Neorhizobium petrolearium]|uniref:hypothetical protein n=1 Tax=Neorhizobium petrolearium TaxID=515361 RepID=UPI003F80EC64
MSAIYLSSSCSLKSYSATSKGGKSTLKIEIDVSDPLDLGHMLRDLFEIEQQQKAKTEPKSRTKKQAEPRLALPAPLLGLPYFPEEK